MSHINKGRSNRRNHRIAGSRRYTRRSAGLRLKGIFTLFVCSFLLVITLSFGLFTTWSRAQDNDDVRVYKYYTSIEVQYGDTLWDIASAYSDESYEDYHAYIKEVMSINRMTDSDITPGTSLVVPYHSTEFIE